ncbi:DUF3160 domain-containing protein [Clostridia bacterium]|nr:DUF3160 domain-containing protein [Clostridia bacterium]
MQYAKGNARAILFVCLGLLLMLIVPGCQVNKEVAEEPVQVEPELETNATFVFDFSDSENIRNIDVDYVESNIVATVPSYQVSNNLSNIVNLEQFGYFSPDQQKKLVENGFVVTPSKEEQLFYIYEKNEYLKLPSFVTTDSVLQVYHIFYDYSLRLLEQEKLLGYLEELTEHMMVKSMEVYELLDNPDVKEAQKNNVAYFGVALKCLDKDLPEGLSQDTIDLIESEFQKIVDMQGFESSSLFPFELDYSQYKPRGHYTRNDDFKRYFKTMMWYGQAPFPLYRVVEDEKVRNLEGTVQAMLISCMISMQDEGTKDIELWDKIYSPTVFYVGSSDDLSVLEYRKIMQTVFGNELDFNDLSDKQNMDLFYKEADKLPEPKIQAKYSEVTTPVGKQFRFMGQRYTPDADIIQNLVEPITRPIPSGLDVMGCIGSERAYQIMVEQYKVLEEYPQYQEKHEQLKDEFGSLPLDTWQSNMYYGWMWTLKGLLEEYDAGYPSFMTNQAWSDKSLSTALASWSELKHDTVLYGKQSGAECGGGEEPPTVKGYIEPSMEVYNRLLWLTKYSRANLSKRDLMIPELESKMERFEELLTFLLECSEKELNNEELSSEDYDQLLTYGGLLEYLTSSFAGDGTRWFEITSDTDKNMAVIADIHTIAPNSLSPGGYFEVGVGPAHEIFVVVPIGGSLYLTRGATFSYYEFTSTERLTDESWQQMLKDELAPKQADWTRSFIVGNKEEVPEPVSPYTTGC